MLSFRNNVLETPIRGAAPLNPGPAADGGARVMQMKKVKSYQILVKSQGVPLKVSSAE